MYVLASDGVDRRLDANGAIAASIAAIDNWFAGETNGRRLRFDTSGGQLDVTFVRLQRNEAELAAAQAYLRDKIEAELREAGLLKPMKLYTAFYDGVSDHSCGGAPWPPDLVGQVTALYLRGLPSSPVPCDSNVFGAPDGRMSYWDFAALHEMLHALGAVGEGAPHHTLRGHSSDDPRDLMYAGDQPWRPQFLDIGRDDYFDHGRGDCFDLARSVFLTPAAPGAQKPPGW